MFAINPSSSLLYVVRHRSLADAHIKYQALLIALAPCQQRRYPCSVPSLLALALESNRALDNTDGEVWEAVPRLLQVKVDVHALPRAVHPCAR